jgi:PAS domain S-box-containing protein
MGDSAIPSRLGTPTVLLSAPIIDIGDAIDAAAARQAIRESEERFRTLASHAPVGIYLTDPNGDCLFVNNTWCRMTGLTPEEARGKGWVKALHPDDRERVAAEWYEAAVHRKPFAGEYRYLRPDGVVTWLQASAVEYHNAEGQVVGHIGSVVDITARKQAEFALKEAKEQAEAANRSKDRFLAVLSHELRTPLTPVLMSVAARLMDPDLSPELRDELTMIRRNVELETKLIDDLLDLSRITSGKLALRPQVVDLNDAVRHVCSICRDQILEKSIKFHCELDANAGEVTADPARLQQVLWNVLKNAAKFTPEGGQIELTTRRSAGDRVSVRVRDTGAGIAPETLPRVFDAFEQGDPRVSRQFGGLGLGLAITKSLVELHHGTIRAESDGPGRGSVFTIEFPARPAPVARPAPRPPQAKNDRLRLLIVEDHADTAMVLRKLLSASGYLVKTAACAESAMKMIEQEPFDLLISDIGLPDSNGYELMKRIRAAHAIRGIAMSGFGMDEDIRKSREAGFLDHLVKPVNVAQLHEIIRRVSAAPVA